MSNSKPIYQLYYHQSTGGAIPHKMDHRQSTKHDPLWGLDCSGLMWVKVWDHLQDRWPWCQLMCYIPRSVIAEFSIRLFTDAVENSTEGLVKGFKRCIHSSFLRNTQPGGASCFLGTGQLCAANKLRMWIMLKSNGKTDVALTKVYVVHSPAVLTAGLQVQRGHVLKDSLSLSML